MHNKTEQLVEQLDNSTIRCKACNKIFKVKNILNGLCIDCTLQKMGEDSEDE